MRNLSNNNNDILLMVGGDVSKGFFKTARRVANS